MLLSRQPQHFNEELLRYRKKLSGLHSYYEQLMNLGDLMQANISQALTREECAGWQLYAGRSERLHDHVEMLREYLLQLRELYQSQVDRPTEPCHEHPDRGDHHFPAPDPHRRLVRHELSRHAGIWLEIRLSGSHPHQYPHYRSGDPLFQEEKDAVNGPTEELTGRRLPGIMNGSAAMAELADAQDLGSCIERCVGSSPTGRMIKKAVFQQISFCWKRLKTGLFVLQTSSAYHV